MNGQTVKYRIAITEYSTLKGFGYSCSVEKEFDTIDSVVNALEYSKNTLTEEFSKVHVDEHNRSNMSFAIVDNSTGLILTKIAAHAYTISEDGREYLYRGHKITTEFDNEINKDVLVVHRIDGRPHTIRSSIQHALDTIDWMCCTMENAAIAKMALSETNKEKEGE